MEIYPIGIERIEELVDYADSNGYKNIYVYLTEDLREIMMVVMDNDGFSELLTSNRFYRTEKQIDDAEDMILGLINSGAKSERLCHFSLLFYQGRSHNLQLRL